MRLIFALLLLVIPFSGLAQTVAQPTGTIQVEDSAEHDAAVAVRIREILAGLDGYEDVTVAVSSGIVTLRGTTLDGDTADRLNTLVGRVEGVVAIRNEVEETTDVVQRLNPAVERFFERFYQLVAFLPLAGVAFAAFLIVLFLGIILARMRQPWDRIAPNAFIADILRVIIRLAFLVAGIVVALDILGAVALLSTILGAAGIIGLAIGFAVRDTVENFIASIMLSIRQPFRPNDTIEIGGDTGKVIRLTSRATILLSFDGNHIRIPNATVFKSRIVNFTRNDERRFMFDFGVAADADLAQAREIAETTLKNLPFVLKEPAVAVWIEELGDSTVTMRMTAWIEQHTTSFVAARGEAIRLVKLALEAEGIALPEPTYRLISQSDRPSVDIAPEPADITDIQDVAATMETQLERIVEDERQDTEKDDLLKRDAPEE
ncbi:mechanosensitive ion channel family protein [Pseudoprimorskyibacter insulae]|uniref:Small-conductance mechanosensitive channel n=1 Tax=Pseudoprimorskyibacter insulae TaxID=1695997 RepID=A0A2R8AQ37_9RHOB|nr:mechanosensitive ion channel family protein [Pseudoprimorskyibacter insulae]SPF78090.1 Small-conductance mechanosensitive channel [Pseudoprimorskyibacter insulae]